MFYSKHSSVQKLEIFQMTYPILLTCFYYYFPLKVHLASALALLPVRNHLENLNRPRFYYNLCYRQENRYCLCLHSGICYGFLSMAEEVEAVVEGHQLKNFSASSNFSFVHKPILMVQRFHMLNRHLSLHCEYSEMTMYCH